MPTRPLATRNLFWLLLIAMTAQLPNAFAEVRNSAAAQVLIRDVNVFDGNSERLALGQDVLVEDNLIKHVGKDLQASDNATVIDGEGRTLMPGLTDAHVHLWAVDGLDKLYNNHDPFYVGAVAADEARLTLMRGFTTVRDTGGPSTGLARAIDAGEIVGPRVYPSGPMVSQTSGHADFRNYNDPHPIMSGQNHMWDRYYSFIADGPDAVTQATREVLRLGASQVKLMAGGGSQSPYDPLDTTQYTVEELRAAVRAAENWGTYVLVHAYHPKSVRMAIKAGVKCIEHGPMIDEPTMKLIAKHDIWLSPQLAWLRPDEEVKADYPPHVFEKFLQIKDKVLEEMRLAAKYKVKLAFGTDLVGRKAMQEWHREFTIRERWFEPVQILRQATSINAQLFAMSGPRNPYQEGRLGVIEAGAYADLLIVDGNPLEDISIMTDPENKLRLIMKDGKVYKNTL